jgi:diguanylate cyclase (GGDEF)-like protein
MDASMHENVALLNLLGHGIMIVDTDLVVHFWNDWLCEKSGVSKNDIEGRNLAECFESINVLKFQRSMESVVENQKSSEYEVPEGFFIPFENRSEEYSSFEFMQQAVTLSPISKNRVIVEIRDETEMSEFRFKINKLRHFEREQTDINYDHLTGLFNRSKLIEDINRSEHNRLVIVNIDDFNEINDFYGHHIGDRYLIDVAKRLKKLCDVNGYELYKLPSDEYAILAANAEVEDQNDFMKHIDDALHTVESAAYLDDQNKIAIYLTAGIALEGSMILRRADIALKRAKELKKEYLIYDESMNIDKKVIEKQKWLEILKDAIENHRIRAYYQPMYHYDSLGVKKFETLVRLIDREGKVVSPFFFLDVAKRAKLYNTITHLVIEQSFAMFADNSYEFSINFSVEDIEHHPTVELLEAKLKSNPDIAKRLVIELLEDEGIENFDTVKAFIDLVKSYGVKVAIDDFGTGYSNFSYLLQLNVDFIKIDASLIKHVHEDENSEKIVETLIDFSRKMGVQIVGEFVHSKEVFDKIREMGIDYAQGYYIDQPRAELSTNPFGA